MLDGYPSQKHHPPLNKIAAFWSDIMVGYNRKFELSKSILLSPDRQWLVITFKPNGYWSDEAIKVRAVIINKQGIEVAISNSMGGEAEYDAILRAESFHAAYGQAIVDMKRIQEAFSSGLRDIDDIMNHVQDQYVIDQASH